MIKQLSIVGICGMLFFQGCSATNINKPDKITEGTDNGLLGYVDTTEASKYHENYREEVVQKVKDVLVNIEVYDFLEETEYEHTIFCKLSENDTKHLARATEQERDNILKPIYDTLDDLQGKLQKEIIRKGYPNVKLVIHLLDYNGNQIR